ncbi:unnamed protein product, partial [Mesorhabditis belari]|uniref:Uncharacterized protein n=1 Tax=Mesorhabditis belari TaxID=2138241 RepID=A0AAF3FS60_9BILA
MSERIRGMRDRRENELNGFLEEEREHLRVYNDEQGNNLNDGQPANLIDSQPENLHDGQPGNLHDGQPEKVEKRTTRMRTRKRKAYPRAKPTLLNVAKPKCSGAQK